MTIKSRVKELEKFAGPPETEQPTHLLICELSSEPNSIGEPSFAILFKGPNVGKDIVRAPDESVADFEARILAAVEPPNSKIGDAHA